MASSDNDDFVANFSNLADFGRVCNDPKLLLDFLFDCNVLVRDLKCLSCFKMCNLIKRKASSDGYRFYCSGCKKERSVRSESCFEKSKLPLKTLVTLIWCWCYRMTKWQGQFMSGACVATTLQWFQYFQNVARKSLLPTDVTLGGPGEVVEIDGIMFGHQLNHRKRQTGGKPKWVFSLIQRGSRIFHMEVVEDREVDTLLPIIKKVVLPCTSICSNEWTAYGELEAQLKLSHFNVCPKPEFKLTGLGSESSEEVVQVQTNTIEGAWANSKYTVKKISDDNFPIHLVEYIYRNINAYGDQNPGMFFLIFVRDMGRNQNQ